MSLVTLLRYGLTRVPINGREPSSGELIMDGRDALIDQIELTKQMSSSVEVPSIEFFRTMAEHQNGWHIG